MARHDQTLDAPTGRSVDAAAKREPDPFETIQQIAGGYALARCLHAVADLGVADRLDDTPRSVVDLAAAVGADPQALGRVVRLLAAHGVFVAQGATVRHSPASQLLRADHPQSLRAFVRLFGAPAGATATPICHKSSLSALAAAIPTTSSARVATAASRVDRGLAGRYVSASSNLRYA